VLGGKINFPAIFWRPFVIQIFDLIGLIEGAKLAGEYY
jgi:hypothetical protein